MAPLRFLCLHGLGSNADIFETQLGPLIKELERDQSAEFTFIDGLVAQPPGPGLAGLYDGPYLGYFGCDQLPPVDDTAAFSLAIQSVAFQKALAAAFDLIDDVVEDEGPFDGLLGFSHGGMLAATFLFRHAAVRPRPPPWGPFRCAVFIAASAPFTEDGRVIEVTEMKELLNVPSVHVAGREDDVFKQSLDLYALCKRDMATLIVHEEGHVMPRGRDDLIAVARAIRGLESKIVMI